MPPNRLDLDILQISLECGVSGLLRVGLLAPLFEAVGPEFLWLFAAVSFEPRRQQAGLKVGIKQKSGIKPPHSKADETIGLVVLMKEPLASFSAGGEGHPCSRVPTLSEH